MMQAVFLSLVPALAWADCTTFPNTDFEGHTLTEHDENTPADCCTTCTATDGCGYWTFVPPALCYLKLSNAGKKPSPVNGTGAYISGCRNQDCSPVPPPQPTPAPAPTDHVCTVGTVCGADFSQDSKGCCPYENAVCCPNNQACCPTGSTCEDNGWYSQCKGAAANETTGLSVCKSGAAKPFSTTLPNVLIIGDSVSIGYTPIVTTAMQKIALVQHSPYDVKDGGAEETAYGVQCLDYFLQSPSGVSLYPDVIMFNWGLHDGPLGNHTSPGQAGLPDVYAAQLEVITQMLIAKQPQAKLLFALTSPYMCAVQNDGCVMNLNNQAAAIMAKYKIPTINLHDSVVEECGPPPQQSCFNTSGCFCPHCAAAGYEFVADKVIVPALTQLLPTHLISGA